MNDAIAPIRLCGLCKLRPRLSVASRSLCAVCKAAALETKRVGNAERNRVAYAAARAANANAAKPAALEASPAAAGKSPRDTIAARPSPRTCARTSLSTASTRSRSLPSATRPFSSTESSPLPPKNSTVVVTLSGASVTDTLDW